MLYLIGCAILWNKNNIKYNLTHLSSQQKPMKNQQLIKYKNPVILKDEEGKVKQTIYDLPGEKHAYGKKVVDDPEPIKYVVNGWQTASEATDPPSKQKNFKQLNKMATKNGLFTAKQQSQLRKQSDVMVQTKKGQKVIPILLPEQNFTYGVPNRPSTPIKLVVGNCYGLEQDEKNATMYNTAASKNKDKKVVAKTTKSQNLREQKVSNTKQYRNRPLFEEKFKMTQFTSTQSAKVDTNLKPFSSTSAQNPNQNAGNQSAAQGQSKK